MVEHRFIIVRNNYKKYNSGQPFSFLFFFFTPRNIIESAKAHIETNLLSDLDSRENFRRSSQLRIQF